MRRRRTDPVLHKLRQLSSNGRRAEALQLLQETLRQNPNHSRAREELTRHLTGRPYTFEEKASDELQEILTGYRSTPGMLGESAPRALRQLSKRLHYLQRELQHILSEADTKTLRQLNQGIMRELNRHRNSRSKPYGIAGVFLILLMGAAGCYYYMKDRAEHAATALHQACDCETTSIDSARQLLAVHDTGLNRTLCRNVSSGAERLRAHIKAAYNRSKELNTILTTIESGQESVVSQGVRRRAEIERMLKLPCHQAKELRQRWAALCKAEQAALNQQRMALVKELLAPIPDREPLSGQVEADLRIVETRCKFLQQRLLLFEDAGEALGITEDNIKPLIGEHEAQNRLMQEIKALQRLLFLLPSAHDYTTYRALLAEVKAQHYATAIELLEVLQQMPEEDTVRGMMQEHGQNLRPGLLQAARTSLLEGGATFSQDFPATREQLLLLEELLSNAALKTRIYELIDTAANQQAYAEKLPELRDGRACIQRSSLDPSRTLQENKTEEWHNPHAIVSREIDPRPLYLGLGLDKRGQFLTVSNLPDLLTRVFHIEGAHIPALARAYVFHHLAQANTAAAEPILSGLRFAPVMRQRMKEFEALRAEAGIELNGNCWLYSSPLHTTAERKFAHWFHKHRKCDFSAELKRNLGALIRVAPRFCGYINELGQPVLFEKTEQGKLIWYMGADAAMTTSRWGEPLLNPIRLSPVFTVERQF